MLKQGQTYWVFIRQALQRPAVAYALTKATIEHRRVEQEFRRRLMAFGSAAPRLEFPNLKLAPGQYWQRNFFSILFLSMFEAMGIPRERRQAYGLVLHAVRGIVTAADNILDKEDKGPVRLRLGGGRVLPNILLSLLEQGLLHEAIAELAGDADTRRRAWEALISALYDIAGEETQEENDVESVLPPDRLMDEVHSFRGGRLLQLAFVVPEITEPAFAGQVRAGREAVHRLGLALQVLDDVTDFAEDITRRNHNVLRSWIVHHAPDGPTDDQALLDIPVASLAIPERLFPEATRQVLTSAVDVALDGFGRLRDIGHSVDHAAGRDLIRIMFHLRGLDRLWAHYSGDLERAETLRET